MRNKAFPILLFLCIATIGCYATIAQVILIREFLNIFYGNELCMGIVFGAWFLGIATGAFAGAKFGHAMKHAFNIFIIILFVMCFVLPAQIFLVRCVRGIWGVGIGEYIPLLPLFLTSIGLILPFSFIIGFVFPFSSKVVWNALTNRDTYNQTENRDHESVIRKLPPDPRSPTTSDMLAQNTWSLQSDTQDAAVDIGVVYIIESMGSLVGGLIFSLFLVSRFQPFTTIALLNTVMFAILSFLLFSFLRGKHICSWKGGGSMTIKSLKYVSLGLLLFTMVVLFSPIPGKVEALSARIRWNTLNPHIELMTSADSKYQHIDIGRQAGQYSIYLNGQYAAVFPNEYEYAQIAHLVMTQHPSPKHILLIGNGLGGIISEMLLYPIETLDYVELDQNLLQLSNRYLSPSDKLALTDKRVTVFHQDGRYYIKHTSGRQFFDIILVNTPDPSTAFLNRFYTLEFFQEAQDVLKPNGILATSVSSAVTYIGKDVGSYTGSLYRTLHETFQHVLVTPGQTNFYFACNREGIITLDIKSLVERYRKFRVKSDYFTEYLFYTLLQPEQVAFIERQLSQRNDLLVNSDARPVTYFLNLVLWDSLTGSRLHGLFHDLKDVRLESFLIPIMIALSGRILYLIFKHFKLRMKAEKHKAISQFHEKIRHCSTGREGNGGAAKKSKKIHPDDNQPESGEGTYTRQLRTHCLIALAITGFTGIALEMVLLYAFQNIYGYIYERMGIIIAIFMVGLALGGYLMNKIIKKNQFPKSKIQNHSLPRKEADPHHWVKILLTMQGIIGFFAFMVPLMVRTLSFYSVLAEVGLIILIGISGVLTGMEFPLVNKILMQTTTDIAVSAGATDGADHIGAFSGAILTGVLFVPLLGVFGTCLILVTLNISSLALIAFSLLFCKRLNMKCG